MENRQVIQIEQPKLKGRRKVVLIVEKDKATLNQLVYSFKENGFKVYAEKNVDKAKIRVSLLDSCDIRLDAVIVDCKIPENEGERFLRFMNYVHNDKLKLVAIVPPDKSEGDMDHDLNVAVIDTSMNIENVATVVNDTLDYSSEEFINHIKKVREINRLEDRLNEFRNRSSTRKRSNSNKFTQKEINEYKNLRMKANRIIAEKFMEVVSIQDKRMRHKRWNELKHHARLLKHEHDLKLRTIRKMYASYKNHRKIA